jgi:sugar phosphate isomerase/epimerase
MKARLPLTAILATTILLANTRADFKDHIGLQMWSLRDNTKAKGLASSLDLVKAWGITEVEGGGASDLTPEQTRAALDARGLKDVSIHVGYDVLAKDVTAVIKDAKILGANYVICPWIPHEGAFDAALGKKVAANFNVWGAAFRAAGIKFGYHPHGYEFTPGSRPGETQLDDLIRATNPADVSFELDVFWAIHGGGDPVKLLEKYTTRWVALHVKDIRKGAPTGFTTGHAPDTDNVTVGTGQVDWKAVIGAAEKVGVKYYFIEDETPTPLECIPPSLAYLRGLKL